MLPLIVLSFLLLQISCFSDASVPYKELWFNQDVDHFSFNTAIYGKSTFRERYLVQGNSRTLQIAFYRLFPIGIGIVGLCKLIRYL